MRCKLSLSVSIELLKMGQVTLKADRMSLCQKVYKISAEEPIPLNFTPWYKDHHILINEGLSQKFCI
jgi:hypothetical protein